MRVIRDLLVMERPGQMTAAQEPMPLKEAAPVELLKHFMRLHRQPPAWQRDLPGLLVRSGLSGLYTGVPDAPESYALLLKKETGPTTFVDLAAVRIERAEALCAALCSRPDHLRVVNEPWNSLFVSPLLSNGFLETGRQYELALNL